MIVTLDFETFFSQDYSLSKLTTLRAARLRAARAGRRDRLDPAA